jgi:hypothetical protein
MSEHSEHKDLMPPPPDRNDVLILVKQIQQQLNFLEKKIDMLVAAQSQARPAGEQRFSRPPRPFKHFDRGFEHKRKPYGDAREGGPGQGHHFEKRQGGEQSGFGQSRRRKHGFSR